MDALQAILKRRSIRRYTDKPVSPETVKSLLEAAMAAPSANNKQPWHFVVITERSILDAVPRFPSLFPYAFRSSAGRTGLWRGDSRRASGVYGAGFIRSGGEHAYRRPGAGTGGGVAGRISAPGAHGGHERFAQGPRWVCAVRAHLYRIPRGGKTSLRQILGI